MSMDFARYEHPAGQSAASRMAKGIARVARKYIEHVPGSSGTYVQPKPVGQSAANLVAAVSQAPPAASQA